VSFCFKFGYASLLNIQFDCMSFSSLVQSIDNCWSVYLINLALASIIHILHSIWMARNNIHFNNANISVQATKMKILTSIYMSVNLAVGFSCIFGSIHLIVGSFQASNIGMIWSEMCSLIFFNVQEFL
jgi:hypothetical protein